MSCIQGAFANCESLFFVKNKNACQINDRQKMSLGNPRAYQFKNIESIYGIVSRSNNNQEIREAHF